MRSNNSWLEREPESSVCRCRAQTSCAYKDVAFFLIPLEFRIKGGKALGVISLSGIAQPVRAGTFGKVFRTMRFDKLGVALFNSRRQFFGLFEVLFGLCVDCL